MTTFDDPFRSSHCLSSQCLCGRHRSQAEHDFELRLQLQPAPIDAAAPPAETRYRGVIASATIRALSTRTR
jgi:nitrate/nitrite transport system substrate-binding protein